MHLIRFFTLVAALVAAPLPARSQILADPSGDWRGTLSTGAIELRVALHLGPISTFDSLDQGALGLPSHMAVEGSRVTVTVEQVGRFEGELSNDGASLVGVWRQGSATLPLRFERGSFTAPNRPQTPAPPYPYRAEDVGYDNPARAGVHLTGTLTIPNGPGRFPAVLLITGSGAQDRDETIFGHKPFLVLADYLTRRGFAVLRVDDRGVGGSTGASANDTTVDYATDVEAGVSWLRSRPDIDPARISLIGHSEGGIIAPIVAAHDHSISRIVLWAGPGLSGADVIVGQVRAIALASGASVAQAEVAAQVQRELLTAIIAAPDAEAAQVAATRVLAGHGAPAPSEATLRQLTSGWYRNFIAYDPAPTLSSVRVPVLAMLGGKDVQVAPGENAPALRNALADNPRARVVELPGLNHLFQTATTGGVDEYRTIEETIAPDALQLIGDWLTVTIP